MELWLSTCVSSSPPEFPSLSSYRYRFGVLAVGICLSLLLVHFAAWESGGTSPVPAEAVVSAEPLEYGAGVAEGGDRRKDQWIGVYSGIILATMLIALAAFAYVGDATHLWFAILHGYSLSFLLLDLWPSMSQHSLLLPFGVSLASACLVYFVRSFLQTKARQPRLDRFLLILGWAAAAAGFAGSLVLVPGYSTALSVVLLLAMLSISAMAALVVSKRGFPLAGFVSIIWIGTAAAMSAALLQTSGVLPAHLPFASMPQVLSLEALLVLLAMAHRLKVLRLEEYAAAASARAKGMFLGSISHEIRTPLTAIMGFAGLARQVEAPVQVRDYLDKIGTSGRHLLAIVNNILDLAKLETGEILLETKEFHLSTVLSTVTRILSPQASENGNELLLCVADDVPRNLRGDPQRLKQVLLNLGGNGAKFTRNGEVRIDVRLADRQRGDGKVALEFSVSDTGIGIEHRDIDLLFRPFTQADGSTTRRFGGAGLGLSISHALVRLMGGELNVQSSPGKGSVFSFTCCFEPVEAPPGDRLESGGVVSRLRILAAEDNQAARTLLAGLLGRLGCSLTISTSGQHALECVAANPEGFDLIFLDWDLQGLDGPETARRMRTAGLPQTTPILMMTTIAGPEAGERLEGLGAHGVLEKPITASGLLDAVMDQLGKKGRDGQPANGISRSEVRDRRAVSGSRVLLVEDNEFNQEVAKILLDQAGVAVDVAVNGAEAVRILEGGGPGYDFVLMDLHMPEMDGFAATRRIRGMPGKENLPIIAMTASAMRCDRENCLAVGMNDHVAKPIDTRHLFAAMARLRQPAG
jgi:two-component system, sensor histidine kinase and response regulator